MPEQFKVSVMWESSNNPDKEIAAQVCLRAEVRAVLETIFERAPDEVYAIVRRVNS